MIVTRLQGGLGNQMFQYATGFAVAQRCNTGLRVDASWFSYQRGDTTRLFELGIFGISPASFPWWWRFVFIRNKLFTTIKEPPNLAFCPKLMDMVDTQRILSGFWPSEKYFSDYEGLIRNEFTFKRKMLPSVLRWSKKIESKNAVSIHIRRGDYANNPVTRAYHGLLPLAYYRKAIDHIAKRCKDPTFFVFSDDLEWVKQNIISDVPMEFVSHTGADYDDMRLMSLCKHHIIANSTFSWWGAWLNPSKDKVVIAPKKWFANTTMDASSIIPQSWTRL